MAHPLTSLTTGLGLHFKPLSDFVDGLSTEKREGLLEFFGFEPTDQLVLVYPDLIKTLTGELPTIIWDNWDSKWVILSEAQNYASH